MILLSYSIKPFPHNPDNTMPSRLLTTLRKKPFENLVGKGENAGNYHFSPFPTMFSTLSKTNINFSVTFILSSAKAFNLDQSEILSFGKEFNLYHTNGNNIVEEDIKKHYGKKRKICHEYFSQLHKNVCYSFKNKLYQFRYIYIDINPSANATNLCTCKTIWSVRIYI